MVNFLHNRARDDILQGFISIYYIDHTQILGRCRICKILAKNLPWDYNSCKWSVNRVSGTLNGGLKSVNRLSNAVMKPQLP